MAKLIRVKKDGPIFHMPRGKATITVHPGKTVAVTDEEHKHFLSIMPLELEDGGAEDAAEVDVEGAEAEKALKLWVKKLKGMTVKDLKALAVTRKLADVDKLDNANKLVEALTQAGPEAA